MKTYHCWRCRKDMPFLEEGEWQEISPIYDNTVRAIINYRVKHQCGLAEAKEKVELEAIDAFKRITGTQISSYEIVYHHRLKEWGSECKQCGFLLRTPKAKYCVNCGKTKKQHITSRLIRTLLP